MQTGQSYIAFGFFYYRDHGFQDDIWIEPKNSTRGNNRNLESIQGWIILEVLSRTESGDPGEFIVTGKAFDKDTIIYTFIKKAEVDHFLSKFRIIHKSI